MWQHLSSRFFENRLPAITIEWSSRLTASTGLFVSQVGPRSRWVSAAYRHGDARVIRLSAPLLRGQSEAELQGTLAHEMIHQWEFDIRKRHPSHGPTFREMMDRMNEEGLGITIRHQLNENVEAWNRYAWRCIRCGMAYHRQRRTIVPSRHLCSRCRGALVEIPLEESKISHPEMLVEPRLETQFNEALLPQQLGFDF
jgi:predicted SprT family Zn-dependent metalloprotease